MKVLTAILLVIVLMSVALPAVADSYKNASEFCKAFSDFEYPSHGACVSVMENLPLEGCKLIGAEGWEETPFKNFGQCVKFLKQLPLQ